VIFFVALEHKIYYSVRRRCANRLCRFKIRLFQQAKNKWEIPAAWRAVVKNDQIAEWRVYADNSPVLRIMQKK
jgi:hypothetical protein